MLDVERDMSARTGQTDVGRVDPECVHVAQEIELVVERRRPDRWRLEPVAQRLVVEHHRHRRDGTIAVPVVNQGMEGMRHRCAWRSVGRTVL